MVRIWYVDSRYPKEGVGYDTLGSAQVGRWSAENRLHS